MAHLKDRMSEERARNGLTQEDLADRLQVSRSAVANWETGHRQPELSHLKAMGRLFGRSVSYLLGHTDDPNGRNDDRLPEPADEGPSPYGEEIVVLFRGKPAKLPDSYLQLIREKLEQDADEHRNRKTES